MNENDLTDAFGNILPEQPSTKGWARTARRRRQRQRAWAGAAAVVVVAAVAIPLGLGLGNSSPQVQATPAPSSDSASESTQLIPDACKAPAVGAVPLDAGELRSDPERIWLCGQELWDGGRRTIGAPDPLVAGASEAVQAFGELELMQGLIDCPVGPVEYTVVVEYADQTHSAVTARGGCGELRDVSDLQDYFRYDGEGYFATLAGLWADQREETSFEFTGTPDLCQSMATSVWRPLELSRLTRAIACDGETQRPLELPGELAEDLLASLNATETGRSEEILFGGPPELVFLTPEGDPLSLVRWGDEGQWAELLAWDQGAENHSWTLPPDLQQRIDDFLASVPRSERPPPEEAPTLGAEETGGLTSKVCADIQSGTVEPDFLDGNDTLPTGVERVWMCGDLNDPFDGPLGPREPLVTEPDRVIDAINALEPGPEGEVACTAMGGLTFYLAIDYSDGDRKVISAETVNCSFVGGGRIGGGKLLNELQPMWAAQRASTGPPAGLGDPQLCDTYTSPQRMPGGYTSILNVAPSDAVSGAACGLSKDATDFDGDVLQRMLPTRVVSAIAKAATSTEPTYHYSAPGLPYLVLLNEFGDPTTVGLLSDGDIQLADGPWTPDDETAALLMDTLQGLRTKPFYEEPAKCSKFVEGQEPARLGDVVSGVACVGMFAVPAKGPDLEASFAQELARRFEEESVAMSWGARSSSVVLQNADGDRVNLYYDQRNHHDATFSPGLTNEAGDRVWELPDDVRAELELYGFDFTQQ